MKAKECAMLRHKRKKLFQLNSNGVFKTSQLNNIAKKLKGFAARKKEKKRKGDRFILFVFLSPRISAFY